MTETRNERSRLAQVAGWLLCAVPLVSVAELALHAKQTTSDVVPESDWALARDAIKAELQPDDLILFEPYWTDPIGRKAFGPLATMKREGSSDQRRWKRAFEVTIRGAKDPDGEGWKKVKEDRYGKVTVTLYENRAYTKVIDDLVDLVSPDRLSVYRVDSGGGEQECSFQRGATSGGSTVVPQGLLVPADKFVCAGGHVGVAVLHATDHHPRLCIYATPMQGATLKMKFSKVKFGPSLHGHSGIQWMVERNPGAEKVAVTFSAFDRPIGTHLHKVGVGWVGFELPTPELAGKEGDLVAEIAPSNQRQFCFEATTREAAP